jgi:hypothetical protein
MRPKTSLTQGPLLTVQLTPEVAARVCADSKAVNSNISRFLRQIINAWYRDLDARNGQDT